MAAAGRSARSAQRVRVGPPPAAARARKAAAAARPRRARGQGRRRPATSARRQEGTPARRTTAPLPAAVCGRAGPERPGPSRMAPRLLPPAGAAVLPLCAGVLRRAVDRSAGTGSRAVE